MPGRPRRWPQRAAGTGRATAHTLAGLLAGLVTWAVLGLIAVLWLTAVYSLVEGPTGHWLLAVGYVVAVPAGPLAALAAVRGLAGMQRARFATFLDVDIEAPGRRPARGARPSSGARPSRSGGRLAARSARQLGYHLSTLVTGVAGGIAVALGWLLAAPRVACTVAGPTRGRPAACWGRPGRRRWPGRSRRWRAAAPRSSPRPTPSGAASNAISTTAPSSACCRWR
ncbi:membrane hypothetical protein [Frankia sp. Hr75.2]|nr:membrane hypothetical protein [Frankia sp. Hr75.2]